MREIGFGLLIVCSASAGVVASGIVARGDEPASRAVPGYPTPREAFEARRRALAGRDWRTGFASSTPEVQAREVEDLVRCWTFREIGIEAGPNVDGHPHRGYDPAEVDRLGLILKAHGVRPSVVSTIALMVDEGSAVRALAARVVERASFHAEMSEILRPAGEETPDLIHRFGELQGVEVSGDRATGWVVWDREAGRRSVRLARTFRRVDGRWYNDTETWDYTLRREIEAAPRAQAGYGSPREAYQARLEALARRDWETSYASATPEVQAREIVSLLTRWPFLEDGVVGGPFVGGELGPCAAQAFESRTREILKRHGVPSFWWFSRLRPRDNWVEATTARIPDKGAFYAEVSERFRGIGTEALESTYEIGPLQRVEISGDHARGFVVWNVHHDWIDGRKEVSQATSLVRDFRKIDGRWFNDSPTWDDEEFNPD